MSKDWITGVLLNPTKQRDVMPQDFLNKGNASLRPRSFPHIVIVLRRPLKRIEVGKIGNGLLDGYVVGSAESDIEGSNLEIQAFSTVALVVVAGRKWRSCSMSSENAQKQSSTHEEHSERCRGE